MGSPLPWGNTLAEKLVEPATVKTERRAKARFSSTRSREESRKRMKTKAFSQHEKLEEQKAASLGSTTPLKKEERNGGEGSFNVLAYLVGLDAFSTEERRRPSLYREEGRDENCRGKIG